MKLKYRKVWASAPASIANLGPGFDRVGLSFSQYRDYVGVEVIGSGNVLSLGAKSSLLGTPNDPRKNIASVAADLVRQRIDPKGELGALQVTVRKEVPVGSGLGSSAASAVAAVLATSTFFEGCHELEVEDLLAIAGEAEAIASGEPHYDNAGAAMYGGYVSVSGLIEIIPYGIKTVGARVLHDLPSWGIAVVTPRVRGITTREARECLPQDCDAFWIKVGMNAIKSISKFWNALAARDIKWFARIVNSEDLITPYRFELYGKEKYEKAIAEAKRVVKAGRFEVAVGLSGAGPSLFAIAETGMKAFTAGLAMKTVLADADIAMVEMNSYGAEIVRVE